MVTHVPLPPDTTLDNRGRPRQEYVTKIRGMTDEELARECYLVILQSARCANNSRADWHWQVDKLIDESTARPGTIYRTAWERCVKDNT